MDAPGYSTPAAKTASGPEPTGKGESLQIPPTPTWHSNPAEAEADHIADRAQAGDADAFRAVYRSPAPETELQYVPAALRPSLFSPGSAGAALSPGDRSALDATGFQRPEDLRIHDSAKTHRLNVLLRTRSFTIGNHILMGAGETQDDESRRRLIYHEAAHSRQQIRSGRPALQPTLDDAKVTAMDNWSLEVNSRAEVAEVVGNLLLNQSERDELLEAFNRNNPDPIEAPARPPAPAAVPMATSVGPEREFTAEDRWKPLIAWVQENHSAFLQRVQSVTPKIYVRTPGRNQAEWQRTRASSIGNPEGMSFIYIPIPSEKKRNEEQILMELHNLERTKRFDNLDERARKGEVSETDYTQRSERLEWESINGTVAALNRPTAYHRVHGEALHNWNLYREWFLHNPAGQEHARIHHANFRRYAPGPGPAQAAAAVPATTPETPDEPPLKKRRTGVATSTAAPALNALSALFAAYSENTEDEAPAASSSDPKQTNKKRQRDS